MRTRKRLNGYRLPSPPLPTNRPTPERSRHAEAIDQPDINGRAFRLGWLVVTRLDAFLAGRLITRETYDAAVAFRRDFEATSGAELADGADR